MCFYTWFCACSIACVRVVLRLRACERVLLRARLPVRLCACAFMPVCQCVLWRRFLRAYIFCSVSFPISVVFDVYLPVFCDCVSANVVVWLCFLAHVVLRLCFCVVIFVRLFSHDQFYLSL